MIKMYCNQQCNACNIGSCNLLIPDLLGTKHGLQTVHSMGKNDVRGVGRWSWQVGDGVASMVWWHFYSLAKQVQ